MGKHTFLPSQAKAKTPAQLQEARRIREWESNNRIAKNWARWPGQERFGDDR